MDKKKLEEMSLEGDRLGQLFVYKDRNEVTKACMVGYDVTQEEFDLMPDYLREHFERPDPRYNEVLKKKPPNVFVIPEETVKDIVAQVEEPLAVTKEFDDAKVADGGVPTTSEKD